MRPAYRLLSVIFAILALIFAAILLALALGWVIPQAYLQSILSIYNNRWIVGIASGVVIPSVMPLLESCREPGTAAERRELCFKLSKIMQRGDTVVAQLAGFNIERHLVAPDGREARAIAERRRILDWRTTEAGKFDIPLLPWTKNARARARLALMRAKPREEDVCIAILQSHKVALDPPEVHP